MVHVHDAALKLQEPEFSGRYVHVQRQTYHNASEYDQEMPQSQTITRHREEETMNDIKHKPALLPPQLSEIIAKLVRAVIAVTALQNKTHTKITIINNIRTIVSEQTATKATGGMW